MVTLAERYILLNSLLFKIITTLLAIPEVCADKMIALYHSSLFAGHQGVIKHIYLLETNFHTRFNILFMFLH